MEPIDLPNRVKESIKTIMDNYASKKPTGLPIEWANSLNPDGSPHGHMIIFRYR